MIETILTLTLPDFMPYTDGVASYQPACMHSLIWELNFMHYSVKHGFIDISVDIVISFVKMRVCSD